jgi:hypothetical protein
MAYRSWVLFLEKDHGRATEERAEAALPLFRGLMNYLTHGK